MEILDQKLRLDIRIVKFQDYIRRKPDSPFGYYGLGMQYLVGGRPSMADRMFLHSLKINPGYMPARIGRIAYLLTEKRFLSAARYYHRHRSFFQKKNLYTSRIQRIVSRLYLDRGFSLYIKKIRSLFVFKEGFGALQRMYFRTPDNPIVNLLLAMFSLKEGTENEKARGIFRNCVCMTGIEDSLRWDLVKALSKGHPDIFKDDKIAGLFSAIPEGALGSNYASFLLQCFIQLQDKDRVTRAFTDFQKKHCSPDTKTLWQYLAFCRNHHIGNNTLLFCCRKLIDSGWVDKVVAAAVRDSKNANTAENTRDLDKILLLYGYQ